MDPILIVLAIAAFLIFRRYRAKYLRQVWRLAMEGQMSLNRAALMLALMLWSTLIFAFLIARAVVIGDAGQALLFGALFGFILLQATLIWRWLLAWQIAHPSQVKWWSPGHNRRLRL
jgi:hypothetical protein